MADQQVAVLIDYENVGLHPIRWLLDQVSESGRVVVKRAYGDWSTVGGSQRDELLALGIEPVHLFRTTSSGKNASDLRLAVDAIDLLYQSPVDTFVLVSSDTDFVPLVTKLRAAGKTVIGAGRKATVSRALVTSCDRYYFLDQADSPVDSQGAERPSRQGVEGDSLLVRAVKVAMDDQGRVSGSKLIQTMQRLDPSFDLRVLGHSTFSRYLNASRSEVRVVPSRGQGDMFVELAAPAPGEGANNAMDPNLWAPRIDAAWLRRAPNAGDGIPGSAAASAAAAVLGAPKLSSSPYKTLQRLLDASADLRGGWRRDGAKIIRR
ncbi:MAG: NYN domain-containing protein [Dehalococcoidia bacterium]|nr:NYN domain-containing protein [Dehalococcoidia bacterium]